MSPDNWVNFLDNMEFDNVAQILYAFQRWRGGLWLFIWRHYLSELILCPQTVACMVYRTLK